MSAVAKLQAVPVNDNSGPVSALRFLAAACEQARETLLTDQESYGFGVILRMIADQVEGGGA